MFVIEVNPRASRMVPYVSKAVGLPLAKMASCLTTGRTLRELLPDQLASGKDHGPLLMAARIISSTNVPHDSDL